jgi:hypothetical protein
VPDQRGSARSDGARLRLGHRALPCRRRPSGPGYYLDGRTLCGEQDFAELLLPDQVHPEAATRASANTSPTWPSVPKPLLALHLNLRPPKYARTQRVLPTVTSETHSFRPRIRPEPAHRTGSSNPRRATAADGVEEAVDGRPQAAGAQQVGVDEVEPDLRLMKSTSVSRAKGRAGRCCPGSD